MRSDLAKPDIGYQVCAVNLLALVGCGERGEVDVSSTHNESFRGSSPTAVNEYYGQFVSRSSSYAAEIERYGEGSEWFGGVWFAEDEFGMPTLFVGVVGGRETLDPDSQKFLNDIGARVTVVENSLQDLHDELDRLLRLRDQVIGPERYSLGTDVMANRVVLHPQKVELSETELSILNVDTQLVIIEEPTNFMDYGASLGDG